MSQRICSTARLSSQLKSVVGTAEVMMVGATLEIPFIKSIDTLQCEALIDQQGARIIRQSPKCQYSSFPQWNDTTQFRCCIDWDIQFSVNIKSSIGEHIILTSDVLTMQNAGASTIPLRLGAKCVGELEISIVFYPNYYSFKYLTVGCYLSEQLSYSLINNVLTDLNTNTIQEKMHAVTSEDDIVSVIAAVDNFTTFLTEEETFHGELSLALNLKTPYHTKVHSPQTTMTQTQRSHSSLFSKQSTSSRNLPETIPLHRVATGAKAFLSKLLGDLPQPPPVTISLIEKQLSIYTQSLLLPIHGPADNNNNNNNSHNKNNNNLNTSTMSSESSPEILLSWTQFAQFCIVSALWFLQQAVAANRLLCQCGSSSNNNNNLTLPELDALRFGFSQYDPELSGMVATSDLYCILQDMGEEYNETELGLTISYLDSDNLGYVDFSEFVRWWCE